MTVQVLKLKIAMYVLVVQVEHEVGIAAGDLPEDPSDIVPEVLVRVLLVVLYLKNLDFGDGGGKKG